MMVYEYERMLDRMNTAPKHVHYLYWFMMKAWSRNINRILQREFDRTFLNERRLWYVRHCQERFDLGLPIGKMSERMDSRPWFDHPHMQRLAQPNFRNREHGRGIS